jgi:hypothetical protein
MGILGRQDFTNRFLDGLEKSDPKFSKETIADVRNSFSEFEKTYIEEIARLMEVYEKPIFGVNLVTSDEKQTVYSVDGCRYKSVFFQLPEQAVQTCGKMYEYYRFFNS